MEKIGVSVGLALGLFSFSALSAPGTTCTYYRDSEKIPHFTAKTKREAWGCLGYFHGLDRAWQSDYLRRTALGRRSEVEGFSALKDDLKMRLFGFGRIADRIVSGLDSATLDSLKAYSEGWNRGAAEAVKNGTVYELRTWKQDFPKWTPRDTVALLLLQSFDQTRRTFEQRFTQAALSARYGDRADSLSDDYGTPWDTTVIKAEDVSLASKKSTSKSASKLRTAKRLPATGAELRSIREFFAFRYLDFLGDSSNKGSNNWVLAPERTEDGTAVLMNDPHLGLATPSFWYWVEMNVDGEGSAFGATLPGGPLIASGTNERVAWGLTNAYFDVSDVAYVSPDQVPDLETFRPKVDVKVLGREIPLSIKKFQRTKDGFPVLPVDGPKGKIALLKWSGFALEAKDFPALLEVPFAKSAKDADGIFSRIGLPSWNYVFADVDGKIGHRVIGKLPRMTAARFGIPVLDTAAEVSEFRKWSFLTADEAPHVLAPARGYVASANEQSWPKDYPLSAGRAQIPSFRAFRIEELLGSRAKHSLEDLRKIQCDVQAVDARFIRPLLLRYLDGFSSLGGTPGWGKPDSYSAAAKKALLDWDGVADLECTGCSVYRKWMDSIMAATGGAETEVYHLLVDPEKYGVDPVEFRGTLESTWKTAIAELKKLDPKSIPVWKDIHRAPFRHLSKNDDWNPRNPIPTPGDSNSVDPGSWDSDHPGEHGSGASMRTQIEMSRPPKVWMQLAGIDLDVPNPNLSAKGSAWMKWRDCVLTKREFPSDFGKRILTSVSW